MFSFRPALTGFCMTSIGRNCNAWPTENDLIRSGKKCYRTGMAKTSDQPPSPKSKKAASSSNETERPTGSRRGGAPLPTGGWAKGFWANHSAVIAAIVAVVAAIASLLGMAISIGAKSSKVDEAYAAASQARVDIARLRESVGRVEGELRRIRAEVRTDAGLGLDASERSVRLPFVLVNIAPGPRKGVRIDFEDGRHIRLVGVPGVGLMPESSADLVDAGGNYLFEAWRDERLHGLCARVAGVVYCYSVGLDGSITRAAGDAL